MSLFGIKEKKEIERLKSQMLPEQVTLADLQGQIAERQKQLDNLQRDLYGTQCQLDALRKEVIETSETILLQSFGLYTPRFSFVNSDEYKARLLEIRAQQKDMIKDKSAVSGNANWTVNGNAAKGRRMVADMQKLLLRAFNSECDDVIEHVKYNNIESSEKRIPASRDAISKLGDLMGVSIQPRYYRLKIEELYLAFEYQQKKQQEKEEQKEAAPECEKKPSSPRRSKKSGKSWRKSRSITRTL